MNGSLDAYILAGGKSSRMGSDKGMLQLHDQALIEYVIQHLRPVFSNIFIVSENKNYEKYGLPLVQDVVKNCGPAGGIDAALHHTHSASIFIISCDMPFADSASIEKLISLHQDNEITLVKNESQIEPMFTIIPAACRIRWRELIQNGIYKLSELFSAFTITFAEGREFTKLNPHLFNNVNTPQELEQAALWMKK